MRHAPGARSQGHTLAELMVVLLILGTVATLAAPSWQQNSPAQADAAVVEIVQALRFAQDEAIRTNSYRLVQCDTGANRLTVSTLNMTASPPVANTTTPVLHPIDKQRYLIDLSTMAPTNGVSLVSCAFTYGVGATSSTLAQVEFDPDGAPVYIAAMNAGVPTVAPLTANGAIVVGSPGHQRTVSVATLTGRVTAP